MVADQHRDDAGRFEERITEQEILKVLDAHDAPFMSAAEIAEDLGVTRQAVRYRLKQMEEKDLVARKQIGARAVGWWAKVAPRLSEETLERVEQAGEEIERGESVSLEELKTEFESE